MKLRLNVVYEDEPEAIVETPDGRRWRRLGHCSRCGECCCTGDPFGGSLGEPAVQGACFYFRWVTPPRGDDRGTGVCIDRTNPYYVMGANTWPSKPSHVEPYKHCTYRFEEVLPGDGSE